MNKLLMISLLSFITNAGYAASEGVDLDDYQYDFSCEKAQIIIDEINDQAKEQANIIASSDINGNFLFSDFNLSLVCEETKYTEKNWLINQTKTATKAHLIATVPTCDNMTETYVQGEKYLNYILLPNHLTLHLQEPISLQRLNGKTDQFLNLFRENGIRLKNIYDSKAFGNFGTINSHHAVSVEFPNCN